MGERFLFYGDIWGVWDSYISLIMSWLECHIIYIWINILCYIIIIYIFMGVLMRLIWATLSLQYSCLLCSLFGSDFGGGSSFTSWMKEHMADYIDAHYIFLEQHYGTWDPFLCHWGRSDIILDACVYGPHGDLLNWMYKTFMILLSCTFLMYICMMLLCYFIIYILYSWCLEGCNTINGIL